MIAIKGMEEMPRCCAECNITTCKGEDEPWNYVCSINLKDIDFNETKRAEHCPLVEIVTCKDCKHWKDSDGVYRRGIGAESKCPINIKEVRDGIFYCGKGERRE